VVSNPAASESAADRVVCVTFAGEYDISNAHEITAHILEAAAGRDVGLVVADLAEVTFFGSVAAEAVVHAARQLQALDIALRLDPVASSVARVLDLLGLPTNFGPSIN
jgi:anti-anti-sigma factor